MPQIHILDKSVAELIAAGEVVERPASIVKELMENSIDAGATQITVEIKQGGISYLRVTDDGCGIDPQDIPKAFIRHATSKVRTAEDLNAIYSFGFRGEALASVAAMCKVELLSRTAGEISGMRYVIEGGVEKSFTEAGCPVGTTIVVRDVFYNTPARMKFLKKDSTEGMNVSNVVDKLAVANPQVSIKFIKDGEVKLHTPGNGDLLAAIHSVFGREFSSGLVPVDGVSGGIQVTGFITSPSGARATRSMQNFFINARFVRSKTCAAALEEACKGTLMTGKFPGCVLNLTIPPETVDVNVHPAKIEVRFSNEKAIFDTVYQACKEALAQHQKKTFPMGEKAAATTSKLSPFALKDFDHSRQQERFSASQYRQMVTSPVPASVPPWHTQTRDTISKPLIFSDSTGAPTHPVSEKSPASKVFYTAPSIPMKPTEHTSKELPKPVQRQPEQQAAQVVTPLVDVTVEQPGPEPKLLGELFGTYILMEYGDQLVLIDKHAAHERYLYNQLRQSQGSPARQLLLEPVRVTLSKPAYNAALSKLDMFEKLGFLAEDFGEGCLLVREAPTVLSVGQVSPAVEEIAQKLLEHRQELLPEVMDELYHSIACRSAIKANDRSSAWELRELAQLVREDEQVRYCPHGRPVIVALGKYEIEKMFGRLG